MRIRRWRLPVEHTGHFVSTVSEEALSGSDDDVIAKVNTLITDVNSRPGDQFAYFVLAFPAERADKRLTLLVLFESLS